MNSSFRNAAAVFKSKTLPITHKQEVCRLYRTALRLTETWAIDRKIFLSEAASLRAEFDEGIKCEPYQVKGLMEAAYKKLDEFVHVDRYVRPYMPGGSEFMRNSPMPLALCYPEGIPQEVLDEFKAVGGHEREVDMSFPEDGRGSRAGQVFIDQATKRAY